MSGTGQMRAITVNGLHITTTATVTDLVTGLVTTTTTTDIIIAQAQSDITCALQPSAASVSVSGRVLNPRGRGVFNATITSTDSSGEVRTTRTNPFGYFRFDEIAIGETYILRVRSKGYTFTPQVVSVSEELIGLTFIAGPPSVLKLITEQ